MQQRPEKNLPRRIAGSYELSVTDSVRILLSPPAKRSHSCLLEIQSQFLPTTLPAMPLTDLLVDATPAICTRLARSRYENVWDKRQQVFETNRFRVQNQNGEFSPTEILFIFKAAVDGEQYIEFGGFRSL